MLNYRKFKAPSLRQVNDKLSSKVSYTSRNLIISLVSSINQYLIFITVEKGFNRVYELVYEKKYYNKASKIIIHLPTHLYKEFRDIALRIFSTKDQKVVKILVQQDSKALYPDKKDLEDILQAPVFKQMFEAPKPVQNK